MLRGLIRFIPKLPQQAAFSLYNYIIGYIMFYVRHPRDKGQDLIGQALATLWMVVHSVQGLMFKVGGNGQGVLLGSRNDDASDQVMRGTHESGQKG